MKLAINDISLDNLPIIVGAVQQLIKLRRFIAEQMPQEDPATVDNILKMVVAPLNISVNATAKPTFAELDPTTLQPMAAPVI